MAFDLDDEELEATLKWRYGERKEKETSTSTVTLGTAYEINKTLVKKYESPLTKKQYEQKKEILENYLSKHNGQYFMLLCNDKKDYTLFNHYNAFFPNEPFTLLWQELTECLNNRGKVYGFDITKDEGAIEIWLMIENEVYCYYFFNYDNGVVEC